MCKLARVLAARTVKMEKANLVSFMRTANFGESAHLSLALAFITEPKPHISKISGAGSNGDLMLFCASLHICTG